VGGNPGELAKNSREFVIRADCMCTRRFCTHPTWDRRPYSKMARDNWSFRYVVAVSTDKKIDPQKVPDGKTPRDDGR